jgi:hypothetical protein
VELINPNFIASSFGFRIVLSRFIHINIVYTVLYEKNNLNILMVDVYIYSMKSIKNLTQTIKDRKSYSSNPQAPVDLGDVE